MSLAQFPTFPSPPTLPRTSPPTSQAQINTSSSSGVHRPCCENGRPMLTDPHTGQTVCSCQYPPGLIPYPRAALPPGLESVYSASAYAAAVSQGYVALGAEGSAFYSPLGTTPFDIKDGMPEAWRSLAASQPGFPYDPVAMYPYGPGKNATRENTNTLKAWLYEHRKNPYPTKGEKIMLAIITKMTLTQVSTWFANARRRLKKENKMTWSPRNRSEDGSDDVDNNEDDDDCVEGRRRDVMSPSTQDLDITSSKPTSPLLSPDPDQSCDKSIFKERIIRVDEDDDFDEDDDDDDDEHEEDSFHRRSCPASDDSPRLGSSRDRSPLRASEDDGDYRSRTRDHRLGRTSASPAGGEDKPSGDFGYRHPGSPGSKPSGPPHHTPGPHSSPPPTSTPPTTRPKIWSISDFINTTSSSASTSSSSVISSSSTNSAAPVSSIITSSSLTSPNVLNRSPFLSPSGLAHTGQPKPLPGPQGFLLLPSGAAAAHWPARFAGLGGHYPLTLTHTTLSYPYNLTTPSRAGLEAHAQAIQMVARAASEAGVNRDGSSPGGDKLPLHPHFARLPVGALFSPARDLDGVRPAVMPTARMMVDHSL